MEGNKNKLREIRIKEGLTISALSRFSTVNEKTIREIEKGNRESTEVTKRKIVKGLNNNPGKTRNWDYDEVFGS